MRFHPGGEALLVARAVAVHHAPEFFPVDRAVVVRTARLVPFQVRIGQGHAKDLGLLDRRVHKLLAQVVVGDPLDAPLERLAAVDGILVAGAEHHQHRPPPAVHRLLHHVLLGLRALHHRQQRVEALALMEGLLLADADHGARVRAVGAAAQRDLVHDRRAIHQPADHAHVRPGGRRVIEDARILGFAGVQGIDQLVARHAHRFSRAVQVEAMAALILHLGEQDGLALKARRPADPVALGLHADDFGMRVLRDLADQGLAVRIGHPVLRLDLAVSVHHRVEMRLLRRDVGLHRFERLGVARDIKRLGVHGDFL